VADASEDRGSTHPPSPFVGEGRGGGKEYRPSPLPMARGGNPPSFDLA
jgi:hypothetical protein